MSNHPRLVRPALDRADCEHRSTLRNARRPRPPVSRRCQSHESEPAEHRFQPADVQAWPPAVARMQDYLSQQQIRQVFAREVISKNTTIQNGCERVQTRHRYTVASQTTDGGSFTIVPRLSQAEQALWLDQFIERSLGIEDADAAGGFQR